ncbi:MAG: hypothetical protein K0Q87_3985, partial [Neobacillus sp.]|nr:hypothetical protein [Neobacillus sp.]
IEPYRLEREVGNHFVQVFYPKVERSSGQGPLLLILI